MQCSIWIEQNSGGYKINKSLELSELEQDFVPTDIRQGPFCTSILDHLAPSTRLKTSGIFHENNPLAKKLIDYLMGQKIDLITISKTATSRWERLIGQCINRFKCEIVTHPSFPSQISVAPKLMINGVIYDLSPSVEKELDIDKELAEIRDSLTQNYNANISAVRSEYQRKINEVERKLHDICSMPYLSLEFALKNNIVLSRQANENRIYANLPFRYNPKYILINSTNTAKIPEKIEKSLIRQVYLNSRMLTTGDNNYKFIDHLLLKDGCQFSHYHTNCWGDYRIPEIIGWDALIQLRDHLQKLLEVINAGSLRNHAVSSEGLPDIEEYLIPKALEEQEKKLARKEEPEEKPKTIESERVSITRQGGAWQIE